LVCLRKIRGPHTISPKSATYYVRMYLIVTPFAGGIIHIPANTIDHKNNAACKKRRSRTETFFGASTYSPSAETSVRALEQSAEACICVCVPPHFSASGEFYTREGCDLCVHSFLWTHASRANVIHSRWLLLQWLDRHGIPASWTQQQLHLIAHLSTSERRSGGRRPALDEFINTTPPLSAAWKSSWRIFHAFCE